MIGPPRKRLDRRAAPKRRIVRASLPPAAPPPPTSGHAVPTNLPVQVTSFIGREREIADVKRLLATTSLLTITGAGGVGKTRLALQVAAEVLAEFPDGVWLVELASLSDPSLVARTVGSALNLPDQSGRPIIVTLTNHLRSRQLLIVLDSCEHLVVACANLAGALLRSCPRLRLLATSREALGTAGETAWRVPSLSLPDPAHPPPLERLPSYEAVRLFVERAKAVAPSFTITSRNAPGIVQVCQRLDGIPLAIELAAARVKGLSVEQIAARLDDRFRLLTGGSRTALPRHQTLRATMDWSYSLLTESEQVLLRRLSAFAGGFTLEAAEGVCAGRGVDSAEVLDLLVRLVDKSLVVAEDQGSETRYRLLETVRRYGWDRLLEAGEADELRRRHRDWYLNLAEETEPKLRGPEQIRSVERLEVEHDNLRAALEWSETEEGGAGAELRLAGALRWFWFVHGHWGEGRSWLERALARSGDMPASALPKALDGAARLARRQGDHVRAAELSETGLAVCRQLGDKEGMAWFLLQLGLGALSHGDYARAMALLEDGLALCRERGDKWYSIIALGNLAILARSQGDSGRAAALFTESVALAREAKDKYQIALRLSRLGILALSQGDDERADAICRESLSLCKEVGDPWATEACLEGLAGVACAHRYFERAARLLGAADGLGEAIGLRRYAAEQADHDQYLAATRTGLGEEAFATTWAEGRAMTLEQAVEYAMAGTDVLSTGDTKRPTGEKPLGLLTAREREVAGLIARGLSNREIAALLVITERTAESHVQHMLDKLVFSSRARIAAWAVEQGLHKPPNRSSLIAHPLLRITFTHKSVP